jgi:hypothetical protein
VGLGRGRTDEEPLGNFLVGEASGDQRHNLSFSIGEVRELVFGASLV